MSGAKKPDINRLIELQKLLQEFSNIERVPERTNATGRYVRENDTEHSFNLAMTAWFLAPFFPKLNEITLIKLALAHDLVEIHAGDTYIYGTPEEIASKSDREAAALNQLRDDWSDFPNVTECISHYETKSSPEACFVYALDKIMPLMMLYINNGHTWKEKDITLEQLKHVKHDKVATSPEVMDYYTQLVQLLEKSPHIIRPR